MTTSVATKQEEIKSACPPDSKHMFLLVNHILVPVITGVLLVISLCSYISSQMTTLACLISISVAYMLVMLH